MAETNLFDSHTATLASHTATLASHTVPLAQHTVKVRDHDHLTGKYRGAAHIRCNLNCKQKSSSFVPMFFPYFSGDDSHLTFEQLLTRAFKMGYEPKIFPKSMENYVSVQVGCVRFLDS